jgi:hypothetical protein
MEYITLTNLIIEWDFLMQSKYCDVLRSEEHQYLEPSMGVTIACTCGELR